jgi:Spy/CpxP family protein refolding chaperone
MRKTILTIGAVSLLATYLVASPCGQKSNKGCEDRYNCSQKMMKKGKSHHKGDMLMSSIMRLDLTKEQRTQIREIIMGARKDMVKPHSAFTVDGFNKEKFIKLSKEHRDNKIVKKGEILEKIYKILKNEQRKQLIDNFGQKENMMGGRYSDKNCYDRG